MTNASAETLLDSRGLRLGTASRAAADRADEALWQMMTFADTPRLALQAAREADAGWALPLLLDAGFRLGLNQPDDRAAARDAARRPRPRSRHARPRASARTSRRLTQAAGRPRGGRAAHLGRPAAGASARRARAALGAPVGSRARRLRQHAAAARRARCPSGTTPIRCSRACSGSTRSASPNATSWRWPRTWAGARSRWRRSSAPTRRRRRACRGPCTPSRTRWRCRAASTTARPGCASSRPAGPTARASRATCGGISRCSGSRRWTSPARCA